VLIPLSLGGRLMFLALAIIASVAIVGVLVYMLYITPSPRDRLE